MRNPAPKLSFFEPEEIRDALIKQCYYAGLPECFRDLVRESFLDLYSWEYNGVSYMPDEKYPVLYAWIHDFMWITGAGGKESDVIMRYLIEKQGFGKKQAENYYLFVRFGWEFPFIGFKAKHKRRNNVRELLSIEKRCYSVAKNYYLR